jgi:hypothetical protein
MVPLQVLLLTGLGMLERSIPAGKLIVEMPKFVTGLMLLLPKVMVNSDLPPWVTFAGLKIALGVITAQAAGAYVTIALPIKIPASLSWEDFNLRNSWRGCMDVLYIWMNMKIAEGITK